MKSYIENVYANWAYLCFAGRTNKDTELRTEAFNNLYFVPVFKSDHFPAIEFINSVVSLMHFNLV